MKSLGLVVLALAFLAIAVDKVRNEHRMTQMYERQAVALERSSDLLERIDVNLEHMDVHFQRRAIDPAAGLTMEQLAEKAARQTDRQVGACWPATDGKPRAYSALEACSR